MTNAPETWESLDKRSDSEIRKFYAGKHVFLTGSTGCLGTIMLERLLYSFPEIAKIYLMIRPKNSVSVKERLAKEFTDNIFDRIREKNPDFAEKIAVVQGDLQEPGLGFSPEDRKVLLDNVNIIIHNASMVNFTARPRIMLRTNVMGTKGMLELAAKCSHLEAFVYVSTAYSHLYNKTIEEKFYPPPADLKTIEEVIRADEETPGGLGERALQSIVGDFLNMYAFSKATTEGVVETFAKTASFPCIVYRPSIVITTLDESYPAWMKNKNGPVGPTMLPYLGLMHTMYINQNCIMDGVPVNMVANFLLALIWNHVTSRKPAEVYNYSSSDWNPFFISKIRKTVIQYMRKYPLKRAVWYTCIILTKCYYAYLMYHTLFHIIPAAIVDLVLLVWKREKPKYLKIVWTASKNIALLRKFMNFQWIIKADKAKELVRRMNPIDRKAFNFDLATLDWHFAMRRHVDSVRYVLKETPEDLEIAKAKARKLKILHYTVCTVFAFLALLLLSHFIRYIFS